MGHPLARFAAHEGGCRTRAHRCRAHRLRRRRRDRYDDDHHVGRRHHHHDRTSLDHFGIAEHHGPGDHHDGAADHDDLRPSGADLEFTVVAGSVDGPDRIEATVGEEIVITVSADVTDEVHLHGYDLFADVAPGAPARLDVVTDIPGIFEMELEGARLVVTELEVR